MADVKAVVPPTKKAFMVTFLDKRYWKNRNWVGAVLVSVFGAAVFLVIVTINEMIDQKPLRLVLPLLVLGITFYGIIGWAKKVHSRNGGGGMWDCCIKYVFCFCCCCNACSDWTENQYEQVEQELKPARSPKTTGLVSLPPPPPAATTPASITRTVSKSTPSATQSMTHSDNDDDDSDEKEKSHVITIPPSSSSSAPSTNGEDGDEDEGSDEGM